MSDWEQALRNHKESLMNRNFLRGAALAWLGLGLIGVSSAQSWVDLCDNPTTTTPKFSPNTYAATGDATELFGFFLGLSGTAEFETCFANTLNQPVAGGIGFHIGSIGSIQDDLSETGPIDNFMALTYGMYGGTGGNWGYARTIRQDDNATDGGTRTAFTNIDTSYYGASDRYVIAQTTQNNIRVNLRVDVVGDACRFQWDLRNLGNATNLGLEFGQYVTALGPSDTLYAGYVQVPGLRPLSTDTRFSLQPNSGAVVPELAMPPFVNFGATQAKAYGLQVLTRPTEGQNSPFAEQTPVDTLDIGSAVFLLGNITANDRSMPDQMQPDRPFINQTPFGPVSDAAYIQRWNPTPVGAAAEFNNTRTIVAYYKSVTGNSDYARPYSAVVDAPKVIAVKDENPNEFNYNDGQGVDPGFATIRVYIDNARGFATVNQAVPLNNVRIQLDLPEGMSEFNGTDATPRRIVKIIDRVEPNDPTAIPSTPIRFVDFQVQVDPTVVGPAQYTVTIEPQPGSRKVITGSINVASQPRLNIRAQANLVSAPWAFSNNSWAAILGGGEDPLVQDVDFQAFEWDAELQAYVIQTAPKRGYGTWIVSTKDVGSKQLGGNPQTPPDFRTGAPQVDLQFGWNLVANPYNYTIPVGQLVGVSGSNDDESLTFAQMAQQGIISPSLAFWDPTTQSYKFTNGLADVLVPNRGYWIYVNTPGANLTLVWPPMLEPFVPAGTGGIQVKNGGWKLQLSARGGKSVDDQNFVGTATNSQVAKSLRTHKPPVAPVAGAISSAFKVVEGGRTLNLAQAFQPKASRLEWEWQVYSQSGGAVTLTWPTIADVPANVRIKMVDTQTGATTDLRRSRNVTFQAGARTTRTFKVVAETGGVASSVLGTVSADRTGRGFNLPVTIRYQLAESANVSVRILQAGREIRTITRDRADAAGAKTLSWNLTDAANRGVRNGIYQVEVTATPEGGQPETKVVSVAVYR